MPQREISCFLCKEMLYEHLAEKMDSRRSEAVKGHLNKCTSCTHELQTLKGAHSYIQKLSHTSLMPDFIESMEDQETVHVRFIQLFKWGNWPNSLRWTVQALALGCVVAVVFTSVSKKIQSAKIAKNISAQQSIPDESADDGDEVVASGEAEDDNEDLAYVEEGDEGEEAPTPAEEQKPTPEVGALPAPAPSEETEKSTAAAGTSRAVRSAAAKGFVYRGNLIANDLAAAAPSILQKIVSLGGKKAGEVELGWGRQGGNYYHFSLPENKYNELSLFLKTMGRINVTKDSHPRVMPTGLVRMILFVRGSKNSSQKAPPDEEPSVPTEGSESAIPSPPSEIQNAAPSPPPPDEAAPTAPPTAPDNSTPPSGQEPETEVE